MASPKELVAAVALATGVASETITIHDRNLLMAGLRTEGQRGRGTSTVTPTDAANLLIATVASRNVKDSAATVRHFALEAEVLASDIQRCIDGREPQERYAYTLPSNGDAFFIVGFTGATVRAIAGLLKGNV